MRRSSLSFLALSAFAFHVAGCGGSSGVAPATNDDGGAPHGDAGAGADSGLAQDGGSAGDAGAWVAPCNALTPAPSVLYVLFDASSGMRSFLGASGSGTLIGSSLASPLLAQAQEGLMYTPAAIADCSSAANEYATFSSAGVPFEAAPQAASDITRSLTAAHWDGGVTASGEDPWYLEAALAGAYSAVAQAAGASPVNRRAVLLFLDRDFNVAPTDCAGHVDAITESASALAAGVETYVVYLGNADYPDGGVPGTPESHAEQLARAMSAGAPAFFNASSQAPNAAAAQASLALSSVVADLGSCLYETPSAMPAGAALRFDDFAPLLSNGAKTTVSVSPAASCAGDDAQATPLYTVDGSQIRFCPSTCARLQASLVADQSYTNALNQGRATPLPLLPAFVTWDSSCAGDGG